MASAEGVTLTDEVSAKRRIIRKDATGGSSGDQPVAIVDDREMLSVVIQREVSSQSIEEWKRSIMKDERESVNNTLQKHQKMQEVPEMLRQNEYSKKCFDPLVVSIGPCHYGKQELDSLEKFKFQLTRQYVNSCKQSSIDQLYENVSLVAGDVRKCYTEHSTKDFDHEAFTKMMFLDGCFILQFAYCIGNDDERKQMKMKSHDIAFVQRDLFLLENQLPFKVLEVLMSSRFTVEEGFEMINKYIQRTRALHPGGNSWIEKVKNFFKAKKSEAEANAGGSPIHLLDLVWRQLIDINAFKTESKDGDWCTFRSAQDLKTAGIHFRPSKTHRFTDISYESKFYRAVLRLPPMTIDDSTKSLLLNLVAYEMSPNGPSVSGVTSYIWFIDTLIDHSEDVKELRRKGILLNYLGSDEQVADLFNNIANDLVPNPYAYTDVKWQIEKHYKNKIKLWITEWVNTHFSSPWTVLAFLGAFIALVLSFIQTYCGVFECKT